MVVAAGFACTLERLRLRCYSPALSLAGTAGLPKAPKTSCWGRAIAGSRIRVAGVLQWRNYG
jgi:hypothetical protein